MKTVSETFDQLCTQAEMSFDETRAMSFEQALLEILNYVKAQPEARELFVEKFQQMLNAAAPPFEALAFCMRELQWEEIKNLALERFQPAIDPRSHALAGLISAYDEDWPDQDLYHYYSGQSL